MLDTPKASRESTRVAADIPQAYFRGVANRRDAMNVARRYCRLGAPVSEIEDLANAVEQRAKSINREGVT